MLLQNVTYGICLIQKPLRDVLLLCKSCSVGVLYPHTPVLLQKAAYDFCFIPQLLCDVLLLCKLCSAGGIIPPHPRTVALLPIRLLFNSSLYEINSNSQPCALWGNYNPTPPNCCVIHHTTFSKITDCMRLTVIVSPALCGGIIPPLPHTVALYLTRFLIK